MIGNYTLDWSSFVVLYAVFTEFSYVKERYLASDC